MFGDEGFCRSLLSQMLGTRWLFGPILINGGKSGALKINDRKSMGFTEVIGPL